MPRPATFLTIRALRPLVSGLERAGHDVAPILAAIELDRQILDDPDARVPTTVAMNLLSVAVDRTGDQNLGLHIAEHADLASADVHFYAMASSATLGDAFDRLCRYQRLIHETNPLTLRRSAGAATLRHALASGAPAPRQTAEFLLAAWLRAGRAVTGTNWSPSAVHFAHAAPPDAAEHLRIFGVSVKFSMGHNELVVSHQTLALPCERSDHALLTLLDRYAMDRLDRAPQTNRVADRVRSLLVGELQTGEPTAIRIASRLKVSERTLNRMLAEEGTSFREVMETLRRELAIRHLTERRISIAEVGFLLGFAELSSFHRAFKRWTGRTPAGFRREVWRK